MVEGKGSKNEGELKAVDLVLKALQRANGFHEFIEAAQPKIDISNLIVPLSISVRLAESSASSKTFTTSGSSTPT